MTSQISKFKNIYFYEDAHLKTETVLRKARKLLREKKLKIVILTEDDFPLEYGIKAIAIICKKHYRRPKTMLYNSLGSVELSYDFDRAKYLSTHSTLDRRLRGAGVGQLLYSKAIDWALRKGLKVGSSDSSSNQAVNCWVRLSGKYNMRFVRKTNRFYVLGKK